MKSINTNFTTIEAVTNDLIKNLSEEDKNNIRSTKESELLKFHFGLGTMIRNQYGLWKDNQELMDDCGVSEPSLSHILCKFFLQIICHPIIKVDHKPIHSNAPITRQ